ncbi:MAG: L-serine ammonia-lyase, iron-sulfur-dependent, subunit alpha [Clostridiales bacterium]|nr:L-serine ammonia-lyase, iron-sulfur-dependent, subunit alpha [Clostridiales bacterium]
MQSLRKIYRIGRGPSSSHTMGPERAVLILKERFKDADCFKVTLYGSLALTGKGHGTDRVIEETFAPVPCEVVFDTVTPCDIHPNTMKVEAYKGKKLLGEKRVFSVGGGAIRFEGEPKKASDEVYPLNTYTEIADYCKAHNMRLWQYVSLCEDADIFSYLADVWARMKHTIHEGLIVSGKLPGILGTERRAQKLFNQRHMDESAQTRENRLVCSYAFATSEQNAAGGTVVTAPTCGSCGVVPSVLQYMQETRGFSDEQIVRALAVGGLIGNLIKQNASISGAECGCQAEIGSSCSMAAAALAELFEMGLEQIEYAAEVAMEHHLGLTCDPIAGLVQIPCIERNAVAAMRAINAVSLANFLSDTRKISFDVIVKTMLNTGKDLDIGYRETSVSGLAKFYELPVASQQNDKPNGEEN